MDLIVAGNAGGTNIGESLNRAAGPVGLKSMLCDARAATRGPRIASTLSWRLFGHRPLHLNAYSRSVVAACQEFRPRTLLTTGQSPVTARDLELMGKLGIERVNYSTDDPWNPGFQSRWFSDALLRYDRIYTARRANEEDFRRHGCNSVKYLPFGYDEALWVGPAHSGQSVQTDASVFFAGAAEAFRIECFRALRASGIRLALAGDYWNRDSQLKDSWVGHLDAASLRQWTASVPISVCLVRRANRDGHVMRTFEIPAIGACMVVEDTEEHREIFGHDGSAVRYFTKPAYLVGIVVELLADPASRATLARNASSLIRSGANTYGARLKTMVENS